MKIKVWFSRWAIIFTWGIGNELKFALETACQQHFNFSAITFLNDRSKLPSIFIWIHIGSWEREGLGQLDLTTELVFKSFWSPISMGWDILNIFFLPFITQRTFCSQRVRIGKKEFGNLTVMKTKAYYSFSFCSTWHTNKVLWSAISQRNENPCLACVSGETSQSRWDRNLNTDDNCYGGDSWERTFQVQRLWVEMQSENLMRHDGDGVWLYWVGA